MNKPILTIMAAGMGSRFGGLKQLEPIDESGHIIVDYSIYDAIKAGFDEVLFIIKPAMQEIFMERVGERISKKIKLSLAYQDIADTGGYPVPEGREKPWGTTHALLSAKELYGRSFVAVNADDYYGTEAFKLAYDFLMNNQDPNHHAMVAFLLKNTLSPNGTVTRGICKVSQSNTLVHIAETAGIIETQNGAAAETENGFVRFPNDTVASMNFWAFNSGIMNDLENRFKNFMENQAKKNPLKSECLLPDEVQNCLDHITVDVLPNSGNWFGVTYPQDKASVVASFKKLVESGVYPSEF